MIDKELENLLELDAKTTLGIGTCPDMIKKKDFQFSDFSFSLARLTSLRARFRRLKKIYLSQIFPLCISELGIVLALFTSPCDACWLSRTALELQKESEGRSAPSKRSSGYQTIV